MAPHTDDDEIYRRLMPGGGAGDGTEAGPPDPAEPGVGVAATPTALGTLHVSPAALRAAGQAAGGLGTRTATARTRLAHAHDGLAGAARGFAFTGAVATVHASWDDRLAAIGTDCGEIDGLCQGAAKTHETHDAHVVGSAGRS